VLFILIVRLHMRSSLPTSRVAVAFLANFKRAMKIIAVCSLFGISSAGATDLTIRGLAIGQNFDQKRLQSLLDRMTCTSEQHCRGYLDILGLIAYTEVDGKDRKISNVVLTLNGLQYRYVLGAFTGKYGKPLLLPNKIFGKGPNFIVESGIAEWHAPHGVVLRLSEDVKVQVATLTLSGTSSHSTIGRAGEAPTGTEVTIQKEFEMARPETARINGLMGAELLRLRDRPTSVPSPDLIPLLDQEVKRPDLGDVNVPLHERLVERARLTLVDGIHLSKSSDDLCAAINATADLLISPEGRANLLSAIRCDTNRMRRYRDGVHAIGRQLETTAVALNLPAGWRDRLVAEARASATQEDEQLEQIYRTASKKNQAEEDLLIFMDSHASELHLVNGQFKIDNEVDLKTANELLNRYLALEHQVQ
jgi:hypothetical protein